MSEPGGISVSELNLLIAEAIRREPRVRSVTVRGEVSGFRPHLASGHWYFSLKDEESAVSCVMFRQNNIRAGIRPRDGDRVLVSGYVDVYPKNGSYQLYAMSLRPDGTGDLFLQFEELKRKLSAEGLFDPARKRVLPMVPRKVAVVTSASGAAWQDILNVSAMRNPSVPIVLVPVTVQGVRAAAEIAAGIRAANEQTDADVLIVARGGGSAACRAGRRNPGPASIRRRRNGCFQRTSGFPGSLPPSGSSARFRLRQGSRPACRPAG